MPSPGELRLLCRQLTSVPPQELVLLLPSLIQYVEACKSALSSTLDKSAKGDELETQSLLHKLKTQISTLLGSRSSQGRFVAVCLIKTAVDVGGWECLKASEPWVRSLLNLLQKPDPQASKELCIVAITRIYTLASQYQALTREIVTPTLPTFISNCLSLIRQSGSGRPRRVSLRLVETVFSAFSTLVTLYPTTFRPSCPQLRNELWAYLAPTASDSNIVPKSLQVAGRRLTILLHYTAPKNGGSEEWSKLLAELIKVIHETADQVFRAVEEYNESGPTNGQHNLDFSQDAQGGEETSENLPSWRGIRAGSQRLSGCFEYLAEFFRCPTQSSVVVPMRDLVDLVTRISFVVPHHGLLYNPSVEKLERDELWSVIPNVHLALLHFMQAWTERMDRNISSIAGDVLDQIVRIFSNGEVSQEFRKAAYFVTKHLLNFAGSTLTKAKAESLGPIIRSCCRDVSRRRRCVDVSATTEPRTNGSAPKPATGNSELYLSSKPAISSMTEELDSKLRAEADELLRALVSQVSRLHHTHQALIYTTAITFGSKETVLSTVLHPARDKNGSIYPESTMPYLVKRFPDDDITQISLYNIRTALQGRGSLSVFEHTAIEPADNISGAGRYGETASPPTGGRTTLFPEFTPSLDGTLPEKDVPLRSSDAPVARLPLPAYPNTPLAASPFVVAVASAPDSAKPTTAEEYPRSSDHASLLGYLKRKKTEEDEAGDEPVASGSGDDGGPPLKRREATFASASPGLAEESDSDESVHLNMELDDDDDENTLED